MLRALDDSLGDGIVMGGSLDFGDEVSGTACAWHLGRSPSISHCLNIEKFSEERSKNSSCVYLEIVKFYHQS